MTDVTLGEQILAVQREIGMRERVYPGLVRNGKMKLDESERQIAAMKAVLETLRIIEANVEIVMRGRQ
jgi:hypothetical protein